MTNSLPSLSCEDVRERLAIEALEGGLAEHSPAVEAHCETCADCAAIRDEYEAVAGMLAFGLPEASASPAVRDRLRLHMAASRPAPRRRWLPPAALAAGIAIALLAGLVAGVLLGNSASNGDSPGDLLQRVTRGDRITLRAAEAGEGASGDVLIDRESGAALLAAYSLPALPENHIYQFWFLRTDGTRLDAKVFRPDDSGNAVHVVALPDDFETVRGVWVTLEPGMGNETPLGPNVLIARWQ